MNLQFMTFAVIGVCNTLIHAAAVVVCVELLHFSPTLANGVAFMLANLVSYFLNSTYTFKTSISLYKYYRFFVASLLSLGLTLLIAYIGTLLQVHYLFSLLAAIFIVPVLNFFVLKAWAFAK
ncbi:hypothetical protein ASF84_25130 [Pseudomonas sp. Leaf127]|uniref:GtrA family protein n=1 Tax=Pseudomonas sp. Leaf127 TaxID=1736267 RepID=UPI000702A1B4|nr:GtrA family protein [Pseudomonas sp. Leaf127]KQQ65594.1 hypothetical protein ASF84_25130 [Pseudomonas sp. Leaf127]